MNKDHEIVVYALSAVLIFGVLAGLCFDLKTEKFHFVWTGTAFVVLSLISLCIAIQAYLASIADPTEPAEMLCPHKDGYDDCPTCRH